MAKYTAVLWTDTASRDLETILDYSAEDRPQDVLVILKRLVARASTLTTDPRRGRMVPELRFLALH